MMNPAITSTFDTPAKFIFLRNGDVHRIPYGAKRELTIRLAAVDLTQISGSQRRVACNMEPISFSVHPSGLAYGQWNEEKQPD
jgi:hypothetical protein